MGSDFLFAVPSIMSGVARTLDLGGTFDSYNASKTEEDADRRAIGLDWKLIGGDLSDALYQFEAEQPTPPPTPKQLSLSLVEA